MHIFVHIIHIFARTIIHMNRVSFARIVHRSMCKSAARHKKFIGLRIFDLL